MSALHVHETILAIPSTTTTKLTLQRALSLLACCYWLFLLQCCAHFGHISPLASAQTATTGRAGSLIRVIDQNNLISTPSGFPTANQPTTRFFTTLPTTTTNHQNTSTNQQTKTLKFTIYAGKYWRFNLKANTFASHKEGELRLHKNISLNNYIIDDESWFQYNPLQQQLFAWPSFRIKPGTYQFVLLPSGVDFDSDSENAVTDVEVVANIIVELIRPLIKQTQPQISTDIDHLIDYKFSLDFLHRHSKYPLLVNQIIAVFEALSSNNNNNNKQSSDNVQNLNSTSTISSVSLLDKSKSPTKSTSKLIEFLLIDQSYSSEGEFFSLTWTTQSSLINNTITQIQDCRVSTISDVIARLSNLSSGFTSPDDKYILFYPLETSSNFDSQAILSTERGNHSLKLNLHEPCQKTQVLNSLGIITSSTENYINKSLNVAIPRSIDSGDKEDNNTLQSSPQLISSSTESSKDSQTIYPPRLPSPEARDLETASTSAPILLRSAIDNSTIVTTTKTSTITFSTSTSEPITTSSTAALPSQTDAPPATNISVSGRQDSVVSEPIAEKVNNTTLDKQARAKPDNNPDLELLPVTTPVTVVAQTTTAADINLVSQQQPKVLLQTKSSINLLDANDSPIVIPTTTIMSSDMQNPPVDSATLPTWTTTTTTSPIIMPNSSKVISSDSKLNNLDLLASPVKETSNPTITPETGLNEDLMGILDNIMNYLLSVAVPASIIVGTILIISILIALCHLCIKRKRSKEFQVKNRFKFRYGSERRGFLKNSSKPVILDADRKSLSCGGPTPQHQPSHVNSDTNSKNDKRTGLTFLQMQPISSGVNSTTYKPRDAPSWGNIGLGSG